MGWPHWKQTLPMLIPCKTLQFPKPHIYIAITFEPVLLFQNSFGFRMYLYGEDSAKVQFPIFTYVGMGGFRRLCSKITKDSVCRTAQASLGLLNKSVHLKPVNCSLGFLNIFSVFLYHQSITGGFQ